MDDPEVDRLPHHWTAALPDGLAPLTDMQIGVLAERLTAAAGEPVEGETVLRLLVRYLQLWRAADRLMELTGHVLADQRQWPQSLVEAEGHLHLALDSHDDL